MQSVRRPKRENKRGNEVDDIQDTFNLILCVSDNSGELRDIHQTQMVEAADGNQWGVYVFMKSPLVANRCGR
ncbi:unnamed protein product [Schistosoma margrebowiei]|uniref:Uncharacterized protein n=1 Tax=Schistosoma margrebowiei TaxID=48269 RepID=A0A183MWC8_9TREM|nr:unnamed protein product [Schistosoma margrebowiei]